MAEKMQFELDLDTSPFLASIATAQAGALGVGSAMRAGMATAGTSASASAKLVVEQTKKLAQG